MNSISLLILAVLVALTHQSEDSLLLNKLIINDNPSISASKTNKNDENILMYRINDEKSVYILNKLNNKFSLKDSSKLNLYLANSIKIKINKDKNSRFKRANNQKQ